MKKTMEGVLFNRLEKMGGKDYYHVGFEDKDKKFGEILASIVPKVGMKKKAKITVEVFDEKNKQN
jgi:hypothetical protein